MAEDKEPGMAYNMKFLNRIFAILSVLFLFVVIWVFLDDFVRPWKVVQLEAQKIKRKKIEEKIKAAEKKVDQKKIAEVSQKIDQAQKLVSDREDEIGEIKNKLALVQVEIKNETIVNGQLNSQVAALGFDHGLAHSKHSFNADFLGK